jgi:hypothetical protein
VGGRSTPCSGRFTPGKDPVPIVHEAGWGQGRSGRAWKISTPPGFDPRTIQPVASRCTDWAIPHQFQCWHSVNYCNGWGGGGEGVNKISNFVLRGVTYFNFLSLFTTTRKFVLRSESSVPQNAIEWHVPLASPRIINVWYVYGARCWCRSGWGTALQTWRSRDRFSMVSLEFFTDIILPAALWPWGRLSL